MACSTCHDRHNTVLDSDTISTLLERSGYAVISTTGEAVVVCPTCEGDMSE